MLNKDCFAYKNGECIALRTIYCKYMGKCSFYQNADNYKKRLKAINKKMG